MKAKISYARILSAIAIGWGLHGTAQAQLVINDDLRGASSSYDWLTFEGACLTAGNGQGSIPPCVGLLPYEARPVHKFHVGGTTGRLPDLPGQGALRLTNGDFELLGKNGDGMTGAIVSKFTLPTSNGIQVLFETKTYGGDFENGTGADGIGFFLADGSATPGVGATGGSLGYSCSNVNGEANGVAGGYLGIGIDEFGNFSNPLDNTDSGPGFKAGRISLRGAGDTSITTLNAKWPNLYTAAYLLSGTAAERRDKRRLAVKRTCKTGLLHNFTGATIADPVTGAPVLNTEATSVKLPYNYPFIGYSDLPLGSKIANQQGIELPKRGDAIPIAYSLKITEAGLLDFSYSINGGSPITVVTDYPITAGNGPLPSTFRFGFLAATGGGNNVHEILCFKASPTSESSTSPAANAQPLGEVSDSVQLYSANYSSLNWWGQVTARSLLYSTTTDEVSIAPYANWDANCGLTGTLKCTAMENAPVVTVQEPDNRNILTWNGVGIPFRSSALSSDQKTALKLADPEVVFQERVEYLRGKREFEIKLFGVGFRSRKGVLGDVIDSSPVWVGPPAAALETLADKLYPAASVPESSGQSYAEFKSAYAQRQNLVYVGANDGFMHAFKAGSFDASGKFVANAVDTPNDGREALAYMPSQVLKTIYSATHSLDFSGAQYAHNTYVNATPATGDLYYDGQWHTWLVSGLGSGGNAGGIISDKTSTAKGALFALDITNPARFSELNASELVIGDWTSDNLSCADVANCNEHMGSIYGTPLIRRLHNGQWAVLFGNGLNSLSGTAGMFIMLVDPANGNKTFKFLNTNAGPVSGNKNGIAYVASSDLDLDHVTDYVYAGDVMGNVWRFDLTSNNADDWQASAVPIFTTAAGQPISTKVTVGVGRVVDGESDFRVMIGLGTGQVLPQTPTSAATYASGTQSLYGIWDWDLKAWNDRSPNSMYQSLERDSRAGTVAISELQTQKITTTVTGSGATDNGIVYRVVSNEDICWAGSSTCTGDNVHMGWKLDLPGLSTTEPRINEQVIYNPTIAYDRFVVNTSIPGNERTYSCDEANPSGYTMTLTTAEGRGSDTSFIDSIEDGLTPRDIVISGVGLGLRGTPVFLTARKTNERRNPRAIMVGQKSDGSLTYQRTNVIDYPSGKVGSRINWKRVQ